MATTTNTPTSIYLDKFTSDPDCLADRAMVASKCKPNPADSEEDKAKGKRRPNKKGLAGRLSNAAELLDNAGKLATGYKRDPKSNSPFSGNGWMDDHCTGMWFSPPDIADPKVQEKVNQMLAEIQAKRLRMLVDGFRDLAEIAISKVGPKAQEMASNFLMKTAFKTAAGILFGKTIIVPIGAAIWTIHDLFQTAEKLAVMAGDKGKAALKALYEIRDIDKKAKDILDSYEKEPHRAHADAMSLMALADPCLRARKCLLVPFKNAASDGTKDEEETANKIEKYKRDNKEDTPAQQAKKIKNMRAITNKARSQAKHGNGCCPGQTGHHILPDAMVEGANCPGYKYKEAPTMCLEGSKNAPTHGTHGMAHKALTDSLKDYTNDTKKTKLSFAEAKKQAIDAVHKAGAIQCDRKCLEAQLDAHYKCAGELDTNSGGGGGGKKKKGCDHSDEIIK